MRRGQLIFAIIAALAVGATAMLAGGGGDGGGGGGGGDDGGGGGGGGDPGDPSTLRELGDTARGITDELPAPVGPLTGEAVDQIVDAGEQLLPPDAQPDAQPDVREPLLAPDAQPVPRLAP